MARYAAAVDQGTTGTRFMVFSHEGTVVSSDYAEHEQIYPQPGWVEHDPMEIWERTKAVTQGALQKGGVSAGDLAAIGITNQRETALVWEKATGRPVYNAIVWQDTRTREICQQLIDEGFEDTVKGKTGLVVATYFSGPKVKWILENVDGTRQRAESGELLFGNIDTWLIWWLTGGPDGGTHVTDYTNASRTMLMDLRTLAWDDEILARLGIPRAMLPEIRPSAEVYGEAWDAQTKVECAITTPNAYSLTADSVLRSIEKINGVEPGSHTPSSAFGAGFVRELDGVVAGEVRFT